MSAQVIATPSVFQPGRQASFLGLMRGEFLKIARLFWILLAILTAGFLVGFVLGAGASTVKADLQHTPLHFLYYEMECNLVIFRILSGILLLILTSFSIGCEYQYGTIRILLARGVGRAQLLFAKLAVLALLSLLLLIAFTLLTALLTCIQMLMLVGNLDALRALVPAYWGNVGIDLLTVLINMGATILLAAAMNSLGRSLTIGLSASLVWFPIDNMGAVFMNVMAELTHQQFWRNLTGYFLGPLLNRLPGMLLSAEAHSGFEAFGSQPLVPVSGAQALWVIGVYALAFAVVAFILTWKRDVKE